LCCFVAVREASSPRRKRRRPRPPPRQACCRENFIFCVPSPVHWGGGGSSSPSSVDVVLSRCVRPRRITVAQVGIWERDGRTRSPHIRARVGLPDRGIAGRATIGLRSGQGLLPVDFGATAGSNGTRPSVAIFRVRKFAMSPTFVCLWATSRWKHFARRNSSSRAFFPVLTRLLCAAVIRPPPRLASVTLFWRA